MPRPTQEQSTKSERFNLRDYHRLWCGFPAGFVYRSDFLLISRYSTLERSPCNPSSRNAAMLTRARFRLFPVRSPLLRECFLFLGVHEMFQFPRCPPCCHGHRQRRWGCPIRRSRDQRLLTAPPRLSQLCHVLHRHAAPRHPPSAHTVFPEGRRVHSDLMTQSLAWSFLRTTALHTYYALGKVQLPTTAPKPGREQECLHP